MKSMKITLLSNNTFSIFGGYEKVVYSVFNVLYTKYNCDISIISLPHYKSLLQSSILEEFKSFKVYRDSDYNTKLQYIKYIFKRRILSNTLMINYKSLKKYLNNISSSDVILVTDPLLIRTVKTIFQKYQIKTKIVYWDHGSLSGYLKGKIQKLIYAKEIFESIRCANAHLCISSGIAEFIKNIDYNAKTYVVYNPLPKYEGSLISKASSPIFLYVGRLDDKQKNISFLLTGLSKLKDKNWKLKIIGSGPDEVKLKRLADKLEISGKIEWHGFKKEPFNDIKEATALLLTSRWEGFPMVLIEAIQKGIPVISSDCNFGPKDIVIQGKNGYLYKEGNMEDFVKIISDVIDGKLQFDTPENIAKTAQRFDEDLVISKIYDTLKKIKEDV